ncbi:MAG TPA: hypothetical protein DEQ61_03050 [Streptomyces sp.]|nr:hypothetical protein [Streptomyces sp.]
MEKIREVAATIPPEDVFRPDADLGPLTRYLQTQEPTGLTLRVPTLVAQGTDDTLVSKPSTDHLVSSLCEKHPSIGYQVYEGADHRETVAGSLHDAEQFVDALSSGRTPDASC